VTEYIGPEDETLVGGELTSPPDPREWNLEELSYRFLGVTGFHAILHNSVLHIEVKVTLTNIVCWSSRGHKHHDFVIPFLTLFVSFNTIDLRWVIGNNALWEFGTMSVIMISIGKSRTITWNGFLPSISLVIPNSVGITVIVTYTRRSTPALIGKLPFRTTQR
jgi:hypothetical protein